MDPRDTGRGREVQAEAVLDAAPAQKIQRVTNLIGWGCGEECHRLGECLQNNGSEDSDDEERKGFGAVTLRNAFGSCVPTLQRHELLLDNEEDVSILDRRLLNNVRESSEPFSVRGIVSGQSATLS